MSRKKPIIDPFRPIAAFAERELGPCGQFLETATILIANSECPFRCIYCDLWQHTLDEPTPHSAVPEQIDVALRELEFNAPPNMARLDQVKLYNAGNWFDGKAIPETDHAAIATRLSGVNRVVIENHPKLCDERVLGFRDRLDGQLEIAIGVETVDEVIMARLDKAVTVAGTERAIEFLQSNGIDVRAFLLFPPPFQTNDIVTPAVESARWCFERGVTAAVLIPLRTSTGIMPQLVEQGDARQPRLDELESAVEAILPYVNRNKGQRLFVDLWDAETHFVDAADASCRIENLHQFNDSQSWS